VVGYLALDGHLGWNTAGIPYDPIGGFKRRCREPREAPSAVGGDTLGIIETRVRIENLKPPKLLI